MKKEVVYTVRFGEGSFYTLVDAPGGAGPVVFQDRRRAEAVADAAGATVGEQALQHMVEVCLAAGWVLWVWQVDGTLVSVPETTGQTREPGSLPDTERKRSRRKRQ